MFLSFFSLFRDFNTISAVDYNIVMFFIQAIADFPTANNGVHAIIHQTKTLEKERGRAFFV